MSKQWQNIRMSKQWQNIRMSKQWQNESVPPSGGHQLSAPSQEGLSVYEGRKPPEHSYSPMALRPGYTVGDSSSMGVEYICSIDNTGFYRTKYLIRGR